MIDEYIEGEYYFRLNKREEENLIELEEALSQKLKEAGIEYVELVKEENQYTRFITGTYHIKVDYEVLEELGDHITNIERVPKGTYNPTTPEDDSLPL